MGLRWQKGSDSMGRGQILYASEGRPHQNTPQLGTAEVVVHGSVWGTAEVVVQLVGVGYSRWQ